MTVIRIQLAGQDFNPITLAPFLRGEKGDKGDPGDSAIAISTDPDNAARLGSDGKIFVPAQSGAVAENSVVLAVVNSIAINLN
jgi:hypothetical protein